MKENNITMISNMETIKQNCIKLLTYTDSLRASEETKEVYKLAENNFDIMRKLLIGSMMYEKTLICVSGLQGAGKTTLMKNFYGLDDSYFNPTKGRGETIPVLITETDKVQKPIVYAITIEKDDNGVFAQAKKEIAPGENFDKASKGNDRSIMYLEMEVPYKRTYNSNISFMLLPGFERDNRYLNDLLEFSVNSSDAAVFVFSESNFAGWENAKWVEKIREKLKENVVFAISGADGSADQNKQVKETSLDVLQIPKDQSDRVVCTADWSEKNENESWIKELEDALQKYAYIGEGYKVEKNGKYICDEMSKLKDNLYSILAELNADVSDEMQDMKDAAWLKLFDKAKEKKRKELNKNLETYIHQAKVKSFETLEDEYSKEPKLRYAKRVLFGNSIKDQFERPRKMVENSLRDENNRMLADQQLVNAIGDSLSQWEKVDDSDAKWLINPEKNEQGEVKLIVEEDFKAMSNDIIALLAPRKKGTPYQEVRECQNPRKLMGALAEFATYYFGIISHDQIVEKTKAQSYYQPSFSEIKLDEIVEGGKSTKRFAAGMLGIMGIDILGDGSLNMISQIAKQFGVAVPVATIASAAIVGTGAVSVVGKDLYRMMREDCSAAKSTVNDIYDDVAKNMLDAYDDCMQRVRDRIEDNLSELGRDGKKITDKYNAKVVVNNTLDLLDRMSVGYAEDAYGFM